MGEHGHNNGFDNNGYHYSNCTGPYCDCDERRYGSPSHGSGGGMSTFGAIICTIGGFLGTALIFTLLDIDVENVPAVVIVVVIAIISGILSAIGSSHGW